MNSVSNPVKIEIRLRIIMMSKLFVTGTIFTYLILLFPGTGSAESFDNIFDEIDGGSRAYYERKRREMRRHLDRQQDNPPPQRNNTPQSEKKDGEQSASDQKTDGTKAEDQKTDVYQEYLDNLTPQQQRCMALEKQLAKSWIEKSKTRQNLPDIIKEIGKWEDAYRKAKSDAERKRCYREVFLFGREFKHSRKCTPIKRKMDEAKLNLDRLQDQRRRVLTNDSGEEDHIISQLADYGCGKQYEKEDNRRNPSIFSFGNDDNDYDRRRNATKNTSILPFATYRTMCVRTCDGFYYPVSFSTLPSRFGLDEAVCKNKCAAPAELFVYKNPGETIEQMISLNGEPYSSAPFAFKYRKEYVKGCSCKETEFSPKDLGLEVTDNNEAKNGDKSSKSSEQKNAER